MEKVQFIKNGHTFLGNRTRVKVIKNKVAPPFKQAEFDIMYNEGISREGNLVDVGVNEGIVEISGAWFSYNDIRLGQGRENSKMYLKENTDIDSMRYENELLSTFDYLNSVNSYRTAQEEYYKLQRELVLAVIEYENLYR